MRKSGEVIMRGPMSRAPGIIRRGPAQKPHEMVTGGPSQMAGEATSRAATYLKGIAGGPILLGLPQARKWSIVQTPIRPRLLGKVRQLVKMETTRMKNFLRENLTSVRCTNGKNP